MAVRCWSHAWSTGRQQTGTRQGKGQQVRSAPMADHDPFSKYMQAAWDSFCDQPVFAFGELRRAISQNYCAYPQMETDPLLAKVRAMPEFAEIRSLGIACQRNFLEHRKQRSSE